MAKAAKIVPQYIKDWHDYVRREPEKHCKEIKQLMKMIEKLLRSRTVRYDDTDVEAFIDFCRLIKHKEGRWVGQPFELSIEQKYIAACIFGFIIFDDELQMEVRYFGSSFYLWPEGWGKQVYFYIGYSSLPLMADGEPAAQVWTLATQKPRRQ